MTPKRIKIVNFRGVGEIEVFFSGEGIIRICGKSGLGKSTIIDAILWCLYGSTKGNIKGDAVINNFIEKGDLTYVELEFNNYMFIRHRKDKEHKNKVLIHNRVNGKWDSKEHTKGTNDLTQIIIDDIIGMSKDVYTKVISFGQLDSKIGDWGELTDKKLKDAFTESLGLGQIDLDKEMIKCYKDDVIQSLKDMEHSPVPLNSRLDVLRFKKQSILENAAMQKKKIKDDTTVNKNDIEYVDSQIVSLNQDIDSNKDFKPMTEEDFNEKSSVFTANREKLVKLNELKSSVQKDYSEKFSDFSLKSNDVKECKRLIDNLNSQIANVESIVGSLCRECGKEYIQIDVVDRLNIVTEKRFLAEDSLISKKDLSAQIELKCTKIKQYIDKIDEAIFQITEQVSGYNNLVIQYNDDQKFQKRLDTLRDTVISKGKYLEMLCEYTPKAYDDQKNINDIAQIDVDIKEVEEDLNGINEKVELKEELIRNLNDVYKTLEVSKGYIVDSITVPLNENIQKIAKSIKPEMDIEIKTLKKLKSGEFREKFSISCTLSDGATDYKEFSGGEKGVCNFCISLGFAITVREMSGSVPDLLFIDEGMSALDIDLANLSLKVISSLSISNVYVISHQTDLQEVIPQTIDLVRTNGKTYLKEV